MNFVSSNFNFSFILWTGDNIDHEVWAQSQATQLDPTKNATSYLEQFFPNTTIYPMFGKFFIDEERFYNFSSKEIMKLFSVISMIQLEALMIGCRQTLELFGKLCFLKKV